MNTNRPLSEIDAAELFLAASQKPRMDFTLPSNWDIILPALRAAFDLGRERQADLIEDGTVIIPAEGHKRIESRDAPKLTTETATWDARNQSWVGLWEDEDGQRFSYIPEIPLAPDTWQEAKK